MTPDQIADDAPLFGDSGPRSRLARCAADRDGGAAAIRQANRGEYGDTQRARVDQRARRLHSRLTGVHSSVVVRGMGLSCALGEGTDACVARLRAGQVVPEILDLSGFEERIRMPFYAMPGGGDLFDPTRVASLLPRVAHEAVTAAGLTRGEIERLPVFIGTSAFRSDGPRSSPRSRARHATPRSRCRCLAMSRSPARFRARLEIAAKSSGSTPRARRPPTRS